VTPEWKLVGEAVSDGIRQIYGSGRELHQNPQIQDYNPHDLNLHQDRLAYHLPRVIFDVEADYQRKVESVDASESGDLWLTPEHRAASGTAHRTQRRRRNFIGSIPDTRMDSSTSDDVPKEDQSRCSRCGACCKGFLSFLFSTVGLTFLLVAYSIIGGLVFMELESGRENRTAEEMEKLRREHLEKHQEQVERQVEKLRREHLVQLWEVTNTLNVLHPDIWMAAADDILKNYTTIVYTYTKMMDWEAGGEDEDNQWSFAGSLLYAITVITTIGTYVCVNRLLAGTMPGVSQCVWYF